MVAYLCAYRSNMQIVVLYILGQYIKPQTFEHIPWNDLFKWSSLPVHYLNLRNYV